MADAREDWHRPTGRQGRRAPAGSASPAHTRRLRRPLTVGLALLAIAVVGALGAGGGLGDDANEGPSGALRVTDGSAPRDGAEPAPAQGDAAPSTPRAAPPPRTADGPLPSAGGVWRDLARAPVAPPMVHRGVWTGNELVVVGADRAATYDPDAERWTALPTSSLVPSAPLVVAWTGDEVLVWGEEETDEGAAAFGARYDPRAGAWRRTAWLDLDLGSWPVAVWADDRLVVWGEGGAASYDPTTDAWRRAADPPTTLPLGPAAAVWTGTEVVAWGDPLGGSSRRPDGAAAAYDPIADAWRELSASPLIGHGTRRTGVWTGADVLALGGQSMRARNVFPGTAGRVAGGAMDPTTGAWRVVGPPAWVEQDTRLSQLQGLALAWTGDAVIAVGGSPDGVGLRYEPATERWTALPSGPVDVAHALGVWTGEAFLLWGGRGEDGSTVDLRTWAPG